jgi:hypothetical protein
MGNIRAASPCARSGGGLRRNQKLTADDIRACFREYYQYRFNEVGLFEFGISGQDMGDIYYWGCQFDAFMITPHRQIMKGFEFKVSRSDFLADQKSQRKRYREGGPKWKAYLRYCNLFYWVCPEGLIKPEEVEAPAGLIWIVGDPPRFHLDVKKRPKRTTQNMDIELQRRILFLFAARAKTRNAAYF